MRSAISVDAAEGRPQTHRSYLHDTREGKGKPKCLNHMENHRAGTGMQTTQRRRNGIGTGTSGWIMPKRGRIRRCGKTTPGNLHLPSTRRSYHRRPPPPSPVGKQRLSVNSGGLTRRSVRYVALLGSSSFSCCYLGCSLSSPFRAVSKGTSTGWKITPRPSPIEPIGVLDYPKWREDAPRNGEVEADYRNLCAPR